MGRLLAQRDGDAAAPQFAAGQPASAPIQGGFLQDISVFSDQFWPAVLTRVYARLGNWVTKQRFELDSFMATMTESGDDNTAQWAGWSQAVIGTMGLLGDISNAVIATAGLIGNGLDSGPSSALTLAQFRKKLDDNYKSLADSVDAMDSKLEIYKLLDRKRKEESGIDPIQWPMRRSIAQAELESAIKRLPTTNDLERHIVRHWINNGLSVPKATGPVQIMYATDYEINRVGTWDYEVLNGYVYDWELRERAQRSNPDSGKAFIRVPTSVTLTMPVAEIPQHAGQTLTALRQAFGTSTPILELGIPVELKFMVFPTQDGDRGYFDDVYMCQWHYNPETDKWHQPDGRQVVGKMLPPDADKRVLDHWLKHGRQPTTGTMIARPLPKGELESRQKW